MGKIMERLIKKPQAYRDCEARAARLEQNVRDLQAELDWAENKNAEIKETLDELLPRIAQVHLQRRADPRLRIRVCTELDPNMLLHAFDHGNDDQMIAMIGERIGVMVAQKLRELNYERWERKDGE